LFLQALLKTCEIVGRMMDAFMELLNVLSKSNSIIYNKKNIRGPESTSREILMLCILIINSPHIK
jgi:hypothetical protein